MDALGIDAVLAGDRGPQAWAADAAAWKSMGATHLTFRTMAAGVESVDALDSIRKFKDAYGERMSHLLIEFNTFTILGRCARTGALGVVTATGEMAVGSRVPFVRDGLGVVATQALTDPRLGTKGLEFLADGRDASQVLDTLVDLDPHIEARQLGIVDATGQSAARTGAKNSDWKGHKCGEGYVSMGNRLTGGDVVDAMADLFWIDSGIGPLGAPDGAIEAGRTGRGRTARRTAFGGYPAANAKTSDIPWSTSAQTITMIRSPNFAVYTTYMCRAFPIIAVAPQIRRSARSANGKSLRVFNKKTGPIGPGVSVKNHEGFASGKQSFSNFHLRGDNKRK